MKILSLTGGGFKGAFQIPIIIDLISKNDYDLILGISVGSINGILAACNNITAMESFWAAIDDDFSLNGIKGFLRPALLEGKGKGKEGLFSLEPIREKLEVTVHLKDIIINYGCGAVKRETKTYHTFYSSSMKTDKELYAAIIASSAIAGLMVPEKITKGSNRGIWSDGGHRHTIPLPDSLTDIKQLDIVSCIPAETQVCKAKVDDIGEGFSWLLDSLMESNLLTELELLKNSTIKKIRFYSPRENLGSLLNASQKKLQWRIDEGEIALKSPLIIRK
jgi:predicted patatin/cPLA2 family phospholipase